MKKSSYVSAIEEVQQPVTAFLRKAGFRKSGRTYNRTVDDGLIHVVNFQMGQYPVGNYVIPGIRENRYGSFAANLGVFLPCVSQIERGNLEKRIFQDYDCEIRERLGVLAESKDVWWSLDSATAETGGLMVGLLEEFGLPFFSQFTDYESVLSHYRVFGRLPFNNDGRSALIAAIISHRIGDLKSATEFFDRAAASAIESKRPGFADHVEKFRKRCGQ